MIRWYEIAANRRALAYILFSVVVLAAIFMGGVLPVRKDIKAAENRALILEDRLREQKALYPLYEGLQLEGDPLEHLRATASLERKGKMPFAVENASLILTSMAESGNLQGAVFIPDPGSLARDSRLLLINGNVGGGYRDFGVFLTGLALTPGFHSVELLEVRSAGEHLRYRLKIWVEID